MPEETAPKPHSSPLLPMKLYRPPPPVGAVVRPRLLELMNQATQQRLTLLQAPAGSGKTVLLSQWCNQRESVQPHHPETSQRHHAAGSSHAVIAWQAVDERDNDLNRFLTYLVAAFQKACRETGQGDIGLDAQEQLQAHQAHQPLSFELVLSPLLDELAQLRGPVYWVLDDAHELTHKAVLKCLSFLLEALPPNVHLLWATRTHLNIGLARWRAQGALTLLDADQLALTATEIGAVAQALQLPLDGAACRHLHQLTAGWAIGVRLLALACESQPERVWQQNGRHPFVADFLGTEVLSPLTEQQRLLLKTAAYLEHFNAPLLDHLHQTSNSAKALQSLVEQGLFLIPQDPSQQWFRLHPLFRDLLAQETDTEAQEIHQRSSQWFAQKGYWVQAIDHALQAQQPHQAAAWIEQLGHGLLETLDAAPLLRWKAELPDEVIQSTPRLTLIYAWGLTWTGQLDAAERLIKANTALSGPLQGPQTIDQTEALLVMAWVEQGRGLLIKAREAALQLYPLIPSEQPALQVQALTLITQTYLTQHNLKAARGYNREAQAIAQRQQNSQLEQQALFDLARIELGKGHLNRCHQVIDQALELSSQKTTSIGRLLMLKAMVNLSQGHFERIEQDLVPGMAIARETRDLHLLSGLIIDSMRQREEGHLDAAFEALAEAERLMHIWDVPQIYYLSWLTALKARLWLDQHKTDLALSWLAQLQQLFERHSDRQPIALLPQQRHYVELFLCRALMAENENPRAIERLEKICQQSADYPASTLYAQVLLALAYHREQHSEAADQQLKQALRVAESESARLPFLSADSSILTLLQAIPDTHPSSAFVQALTAQCHSLRGHTQRFDPTAPATPLSNRERCVLELVAEGLSNQDISERLFISLHTVKTHLRNILQKLDVRSRTQAVSRARALQWL